MIPFIDVTPTTFAAMAALVVAAGLIRGFTGFGLTMVLSPSLSVIIGPAPAVATSIILELVTVLPLLPFAARLTKVRQFWPVTVTACALIPVGSYFLVNVDPVIVRRAISVTVLAFVLVLLKGWRYRGQPSTVANIGIGALAGILVGGTSVGGPPAVLYLMARDNPMQVNRANVITHVTATAVMALGLLWYYGVIDATALWRTAAVAPIAFGAAWAGSHLYGIASDAAFRHIALLFLLMVGLVTLFL